jgi:isochorismate hydrolase
LKEILEMHSNAPLIKRNGEVNAWDNSDFRNAVKATGKKQVLVAGITTDVCVVFVALSLLVAGYTFFVNSDARGTFDTKSATEANDRMRAAGVHVLSSFAVVTDLMRDWRNTPGPPAMLSFFDKYLPTYSFISRAHRAAILTGSLMPGEDA